MKEMETEKIIDMMDAFDDSLRSHYDLLKLYENNLYNVRDLTIKNADEIVLLWERQIFVSEKMDEMNKKIDDIIMFLRQHFANADTKLIVEK